MPKLAIHKRELHHICRKVAQNLQAMRQEKGLSLSDVSRLSGLSLNKLDLLESGQHMPTLPQLYVLAAIFETGSLITLMEGI